MGVLVFVIAIIAAISWFISRAVYLRQVKNAYKTPMVTATLIFILSFVVLAGGVILLLVSTLNFSRH
jgi:hypothetical protein